MLEEKLRDNKNSGKGIEQLIKETEEDFKERRRIAKLAPEELAKEQTIQKNKTIDSLNKPILPSKPLPERRKTDLEKVSDKLGLKAPTIPNYMLKPSVPESKKSNNDIKVPPQNVTFSPQVNVNMGGVVIKNEVDIEKTAEMSKQKIIAELKNYVQITK